MRTFSANIAFDTSTYEGTSRCKTTDMSRSFTFVHSYVAISKAKFALWPSPD